jgi:hypothetical protein
MSHDTTENIYLCPNCFTPADASGACLQCGAEVLECKPGDPDDPCRRPLMDSRGRVQTRAPLWWLQRTVTNLIERRLRNNR